MLKSLEIRYKNVFPIDRTRCRVVVLVEIIQKVIILRVRIITHPCEREQQTDPTKASVAAIIFDDAKRKTCTSAFRGPLEGWKAAAARSSSFVRLRRLLGGLRSLSRSFLRNSLLTVSLAELVTRAEVARLSNGLARENCSQCIRKEKKKGRKKERETHTASYRNGYHSTLPARV